MWVPEEWEGVGIDHVTLVSSDSQPAGTVKSRSYYALRALRERLTETEGVRA